MHNKLLKSIKEDINYALAISLEFLIGIQYP